MEHRANLRGNWVLKVRHGNVNEKMPMLTQLKAALLWHAQRLSLLGTKMGGRLAPLTNPSLLHSSE